MDKHIKEILEDLVFDARTKYECLTEEEDGIKKAIKGYCQGPATGIKENSS